MNYPFWTPGFYPTSVVGTPSNSQLEQMVVESRPASGVGIVVESDTAPDVVLYPDLADSIWHQTSSGVKTGYLYYYNGTAWTPMKVSPGALTGSAFADGSIAITKLTPGTPYYVPQTNADGDEVVWTSPADLFSAGSFAWGKFALASAADNFFCSNLGGTWSEVTKQVAANKLSTVPAATVITAFSDLDDDGLTTYETATTSVKGISHRRYLEMLIDAFTAETETADGDKVPVYDVSEAAGVRMKTVTLANILPNKGTAGTYAGVTGITTDAKGRVTAVTTGSGVVLVAAFKATGALPTVAGYSSGTTVTISPTLGGAADRVELSLICTDPGGDGGYAQNDIIDVDTPQIQTNAARAFFPVWTSADTLKVVRGNGTILIPDKSTCTLGSFDSSKWQFRIVVQRFA